MCNHVRVPLARTVKLKITPLSLILFFFNPSPYKRIGDETMCRFEKWRNCKFFSVVVFVKLQKDIETVKINPRKNLSG